ncbi:hypothetical protein AV530_016960 [Patagioenas fasciata monilis]|uniref:Protein pxr1-like n=1 Tax=Patagioenas fasciata monilis TaxID=372326 RepID=A0A1V4J4W3_PATFA|nr:hypothetical protein AV530_016960 [Patagioenas fasciata monilis]
MPTSSKMDPPLIKTQPVSNSGSTSVITYLKRGKKYCIAVVRTVRICERNNSADTKVSGEGRGGGVSGAEAEIPLQPVVQIMVRQAVPLQPMGIHSGADIHLQPMNDPTLEQVDA